MARGRPTTYSAEIGEKIAANVAYGLTIEEAALACGFKSNTVKNWAKKGNATPRGKYGEFAFALGRAKALRKLERLKRIHEIGMGLRIEKTKHVTMESRPGEKEGEPKPFIKQERIVETSVDWQAIRYLIEREEHGYQVGGVNGGPAILHVPGLITSVADWEKLAKEQQAKAQDFLNRQLEAME